jgi:hypothetical protein
MKDFKIVIGNPLLDKWVYNELFDKPIYNDNIDNIFVTEDNIQNRYLFDVPLKQIIPFIGQDGLLLCASGETIISIIEKIRRDK